MKKKGIYYYKLDTKQLEEVKDDLNKHLELQ